MVASTESMCNFRNPLANWCVFCMSEPRVNLITVSRSKNMEPCRDREDM